MRKRTFIYSAKRHLRRAWLLGSKSLFQSLKYSKNNPKRTIFVAGVQRSGTNMVMGILDRNYTTDVYHERDPRAYDKYELQPLDVIHDLHNQSKAPNFVIKALCELQDLNTLMTEFAPSKVIWVYRAYKPVVNSHIERWTTMPWSIKEIIKNRNGKAGWRGRGMTDETYEIVKSVYHENINNESACALFWYFRNKIFFELELDKNPDVLLTNYDELLNNPQSEGKKICDFLDLDYTEKMTSIIDKNIGTKWQEMDIDEDIVNLCENLEKEFSKIIA